MLHTLREMIARPGVRAVTFDVFDTVLLRNTKPEIRRFFEIAALQSNALGANGINLTRKELFHARMLCTPVAYRTAQLNRYQREARFRDICYLILQSLGVSDEAMIELLVDVEIGYELDNLRGNQAMAGVLNEARAMGRQTYFISDMYLSKTHVERLLNTLLPELKYDGGYCSSENSLTKHAGGLFDYFCECEGSSPCDIVHIGDNHHSDFISACGKGYQALHTPRERSFYVIKGLRERAANFMLRRYMP